MSILEQIRAVRPSSESKTAIRELSPNSHPTSNTIFCLHRDLAYEIMWIRIREVAGSMSLYINEVLITEIPLSFLALVSPVEKGPDDCILQFKHSMFWDNLISDFNVKILFCDLPEDSNIKLGVKIQECDEPRDGLNPAKIECVSLTPGEQMPLKADDFATGLYWDLDKLCDVSIFINGHQHTWTRGDIVARGIFFRHNPERVQFFMPFSNTCSNHTERSLYQSYELRRVDRICVRAETNATVYVLFRKF